MVLLPAFAWNTQGIQPNTFGFPFVGWMIVDILHSQRIIWIEIFNTCFKIFKSCSFTSLDVTYWILRIFHHPLHVYQDIILYKGVEMSSPKQATLVFKKFNSNSRHNSRTTRVFWPRINKKVSVFFHAMILHSLLQLPEWVHPCSLKRMTIATLKGKAISHTAMQTNCAESGE